MLSNRLSIDADHTASFVIQMAEELQCLITKDEIFHPFYFDKLPVISRFRLNIFCALNKCFCIPLPVN